MAGGCSSVSFSIKLADFQASGWADTRHLKPYNPNSENILRVIITSSDERYTIA
jgi:hypothetical protein